MGRGGELVEGGVARTGGVDDATHRHRTHEVVRDGGANTQAHARARTPTRAETQSEAIKRVWQRKLALHPCATHRQHSLRVGNLNAAPRLSPPRPRYSKLAWAWPTLQDTRSIYSECLRLGKSPISDRESRVRSTDSYCSKTDWQWKCAKWATNEWNTDDSVNCASVYLRN